MTGRRYERKLANLFEENGWGVLPAGSSGSGTDSDRPDMLVGHADAGLVLGIEAKSTRSDAYTIKRDEVDQLERFCWHFGAVPTAAIYWKGPPGGNTSYGGWYFKPTEEVPESSVENADGEYNLRPKRRNRREWAQIAELETGDFGATAGA